MMALVVTLRIHTPRTMTEKIHLLLLLMNSAVPMSLWNQTRRLRMRSWTRIMYFMTVPRQSLKKIQMTSQKVSMVILTSNRPNPLKPRRVQLKKRSTKMATSLGQVTCFQEKIKNLQDFQTVNMRTRPLCESIRAEILHNEHDYLTSPPSIQP